jgi:hypothetical protein
MSKKIFNFEIDKEACFWYWIQSLLKWSWYVEEGEFLFYKNSLKNISFKKKRILSEFREVLQQENNGFFWLWNRYSHKPTHPQEQRFCSVIKNAFEDEFDAFWKNEVVLLEEWKKRLERFNFDVLDNFYNKTSTFIERAPKQEKLITVKLLTYGNENFPAGHSHKNFDDVILLNISHLNNTFIERVIGVLAHEHIHILTTLYPTLESLLRKSYQTIFAPLSIKTNGPSWRHLFLETVITSIAGKRNENYLNYLWKKEVSNPFNEKAYIKKDEVNYGFQIRIASYKSLAMTINYLDSEKIVDQSYCDEIAKIWIDIESKKID